MAEEKLFEGQIKKHFHSVGIYPARKWGDGCGGSKGFQWQTFRIAKAEYQPDQ